MKKSKTKGNGCVTKETGSPSGSTNQPGVSRSGARAGQLTSEDLAMEETVMKRRLLIDGWNCDKRLANLTKTFVAFCNDGDEDPKTCKQSLSRMLAQLERVRFDARMNYAEITNLNDEKNKYEEIQEEIREEIERTKLAISEISKDLATARLNQGKMKELDALARLLAKQPDLKSIKEQLKNLQNELQELKNKQVEQSRDLKYKTEALSTLTGAILMMKDSTEGSIEELEGQFSPLQIDNCKTMDMEMEVDSVVEGEKSIPFPLLQPSPLTDFEEAKEALTDVLELIASKETIPDELSFDFDYEIPSVSDENEKGMNNLETLKSPSENGANDTGSGLSMDEVTLMGFREQKDATDADNELQQQVIEVGEEADGRRSRNNSSGSAPTLSDGSIHSGTISISSGSLSSCPSSPSHSP